MDSIATITRKCASPSRTRGNAERRRLSSVDVRKAVLARKRADVHELARLLDDAFVRRQRNDRTAKICRGFLRPARFAVVLTIRPWRRGSISGTASRLAVRCARTPAVNMPSH